MKLARAAILSIALAATAPAQAQAQVGAVIVIWETAVASASYVADLVWSPIRSAWGAVSRSVFGAAQEFKEELQHFRSVIRTDLRRLEEKIGRAGFRLAAVNVRPNLLEEIATLGLTAPFELVLEPTGPITPEEDAKLRAELAELQGVGSRLERALLLLLLNLHERNAQNRPEGYHLSEVAVSLIAFIPEVQLTYSRGE
jgi:hypothetical protein